MAKEPIRITAPFDESVARSLKAGDSVLISGTIIAARDAAHKLMVEALDRGESLPVDMIGKGNRSQAVVEAMKKHGVVYFAAVGGAGALIAKRIKEYKVLAYEDLGPEAIAKMTVEDFPVIVVMDSEGNDFYKVGQAPYVQE